MTMSDEKKMLSLTLGQHMALLVAYRQLAWDLKRKTKSSPSVKQLNRILGQSFKTKKELFNFIHDMLEYNQEHTLDICGMGDCPGIAKNDIADTSIGVWIVAWQNPDGSYAKEPKKLCQDCKDFLAGVNYLGEEVKKEEEQQ
jgi:hypothetical protein